jgi:hypothetical protein
MRPYLLRKTGLATGECLAGGLVGLLRARRVQVAGNSTSGAEVGR